MNAADRAAALVSWWVATYTRHLPAEVGQRRRAEVGSDVWEQRAAGRAAATPAVVVALRRSEAPPAGGLAASRPSDKPRKAEEDRGLVAARRRQRSETPPQGRRSQVHLLAEPLSSGGRWFGVCEALRSRRARATSDNVCPSLSAAAVRLGWAFG